MDSSSLSGLKYQESYFLFLLIAEYRVGQEFGKEEGIKDFAKRLRIPHGYVNALLTRLVEGGLVERREGYSEGRGKASYRYKLTDRLLDEVVRSKCLFDGIVSPCDFKFVYRTYVTRYSGLLKEVRTLERWMMFNLIALSKTGTWEDSHDFTKLNSVIESGLKSYRIASAVRKLSALKVIASLKGHILTIGKTILYINGWHESQLRGSVQSEAIKYTRDYHFQPDSHFPIFEPLNFTGINLQGESNFLHSQVLTDWVNYSLIHDLDNTFVSSINNECRPSIDFEMVVYFQINNIASMILSYHSKLLRQSCNLFDVKIKENVKVKAKEVYETLLSDPHIKREIALERLLPRTELKKLNIKSIDEIAFDCHSMTKEERREMRFNAPINYIRAFILYCLYHAFCIARMHYLLMEKVNAYKPSEFEYHIRFEHAFKLNKPEEWETDEELEDKDIFTCIHAENRSKGTQYKDEFHAFVLGRDACCYHHKKVLPN